MRREALSTVDLAWLRMDRPNNLMIITGLMTLDTPLDLPRLRQLVSQTMLHYKRFKQRVYRARQPLGRVYWEPDPDFNLDYHVISLRLLPPAGEAQLQDFISEIMSIPLDEERPLWRFFLIEQYGQGSALVARLHHAMADGIALMQVLLTMTSDDPAVEPQVEELSSQPPADVPGNSLERGLLLASDLVGKVSARLVHGLTHPRYAQDQVRLAASATLALGRLVLRLPDPSTIFKGEPTHEKRVAWSKALELQDVKTTGKALHATVNDVLLSCVAGGLGRYLQEHGQPNSHVNIRALVPVNLRGEDPAVDLGNRFGLVFLSLPLDIDDPSERLREMKRRMDELKGTPEAAVSLGVLSIMGAVPETVQDVGVMLFDMKGTAVMTNVPGPRQQLYLGGAPINTVMAWVPSSGRLTLGVSIISYHGKVWLGITTDKSLVPDPQRIVQLFGTEFQRLYQIGQDPLLRKPQSFQEMLAALELAEQAIETIIAQKQQAPQPCQAQTRQGTRCKNQALAGSTYCRVHQL